MQGKEQGESGEQPQRLSKMHNYSVHVQQYTCTVSDNLSSSERILQIELTDYRCIVHCTCTVHIEADDP